MGDIITDPILIELLNTCAKPEIDKCWADVNRQENYDYPYIKIWQKVGNFTYHGDLYVYCKGNATHINWRTIRIKKYGVTAR